ncbi:hypothetical protein [Synechocystis sp. CS-94]|nr:hypothetical protein [Synechocystis sp. CS-94]MCT0254082.1 hypothetical protein [Synechocystis sp. CS-94]
MLLLQEIECHIEKIKKLMIAYATDGRTESQPKEYQELFIDLDVLLDKAGYSNPNEFKTIEAFYGACGSTWASRRKLVGEIYSDVIFDIGRRKRTAKEPRNWLIVNALLNENDQLTPIQNQWLKAKNFIYSTPPDYENSIKESINSVESCLKVLRNDKSSTLGQLIKKQSNLDADIIKLISSAYGMLSNKDFVRHGGTSPQPLNEAEATFFLEFAASAIIYLVAKSKADSNSSK